MWARQLKGVTLVHNLTLPTRAGAGRAGPGRAGSLRGKRLQMRHRSASAGPRNHRFFLGSDYPVPSQVTFNMRGTKTPGSKTPPPPPPNQRSGGAGRLGCSPGPHKSLIGLHRGLPLALLGGFVQRGLRLLPRDVPKPPHRSLPLTPPTPFALFLKFHPACNNCFWA